jgi:predicted Fe-Mo cluster-binding NifX family protein
VCSTVVSTGRWPEVVYRSELDGWDGLVANFEHEFAEGRHQDPSLAEWWAAAASLRKGGVDRILVAEPSNRPIERLCADGVRGEVYAHELVTMPPGRVDDFLTIFADVGRPAIERLGAALIGAWRVAMVNDSEAVVMWAFDSWAAWSAYEQADLTAWRDATQSIGVDWRRTLLVDAPLAPLRTGRQPQVEDRRPLDTI